MSAAAALRSPLRAGAAGAGALVGGVLAAAGGWIGLSSLVIDHERPLPLAIDAPRRSLTSRAAGQLSYYVDDTAAGRPLLLVHSINAGASAYEMRPIFARYRGQRPIYALDLPGFGFSERSDRVYTSELYTEAILSLVRDGLGGKDAVDVVALSLGCEFAARATLAEPALFRSLTFVSPSGFTARTAENGSQRAGRGEKGDRLYGLFATPLWSQAFYDLLSTRASIVYFLKRSFMGTPDPSLVDYDYATTHQPGARYAPLYFVSGKLFTPDVCAEVYERLAQPVLVLYDRDGFVRFDMLPRVVAQHDNWQAVRIAPTRGLPQFERMAETARALDDFWQGLDKS